LQANNPIHQIDVGTQVTVAFFAAGSKTRARLESVSDLQVLVHQIQYKHHQQHKLQQTQSQKQQLHLLLSHK